MGERWADIPSFPGYQASTAGRIRNASSGHLKQLYVWRNPRSGYPTVLVCLGRRPSGSRGSRRARVARCVLEAFRGPAKGRLALHGDDDSTHCALSNLRWGTHQENAEDRQAAEWERIKRYYRNRRDPFDEPEPAYTPACDDVAPF